MAVKGIPGIHGRFVHRAAVNCSVETAWGIFTDHDGIGEFSGAQVKLTKGGASNDFSGIFRNER